MAGTRSRATVTGKELHAEKDGAGRKVEERAGAVVVGAAQAAAEAVVEVPVTVRSVVVVATAHVVVKTAHVGTAGGSTVVCGGRPVLAVGAAAAALVLTLVSSVAEARAAEVAADVD